MKAREYVEGPEAWTRFESAMKRIIAVPHSVIKARQEKERWRSEGDPKKRGPKPKPING